MNATKPPFSILFSSFLLYIHEVSTVELKNQGGKAIPTYDGRRSSNLFTVSAPPSPPI